MAEFIEKTDTLNEGREKLNAAIQDAEDAKTTAGQAVNTSNQAKQIAQAAENKADNVQEQFNQVVIEGDSSVEAAQARVDADGNTFTTLKERLDTKETQFASQLAQTVTKEETSINPDDFEGETDYDKVQNAIIYAIEHRKSIKLPRMYDLTNSDPINLKKIGTDRWALKFFGYGGGFYKSDGGTMFTTSFDYTGDYFFYGVDFKGVPGSGLVLFESPKVIRVNTFGCSFRDVDTLTSTDNEGYIQSFRSIGDSVVGGKGNFIDCVGAFDVVFTSTLVEHRENFFNQRNNNSAPYPNLHNVNFKDTIVEGLSGYAYNFSNVEQVSIDGGYFEGNKGGDIIFDDGAFVGIINISNLRGQRGTATTTSFIKWAGIVEYAKVSNVQTVGYTVSDTTLITSGYINVENDRANGVPNNHIDPDNRVLRLSSKPDYETVDNVTISKFGVFTRYRASKTITLPPLGYISTTIKIGTPVRSDALISIQMERADDTKEVILCSYERDGEYIKVWLKNNSDDPNGAGISLRVTVLQAFFSPLG